MKKHGIILKKGKKYQTKRIYNNGYLLAKYKYQPLSIGFQNKMVNDMNQHFCGGWALSDLDLSNEALLERVLKGNKPMAAITAWEKEDLEFCDGLVDRRKYYSYSDQYLLTGAFYTLVAVKGKFKDLFDLQSLYETYKENGIDIDIEEHKNKTIQNFFHDWDGHDYHIELWVLGLILGYPIENTISIYREGVGR
ncbi:MAG: hypothetical protein WDZ80_03830 [Candidatus Paceibacterota bacterium]